MKKQSTNKKPPATPQAKPEGWGFLDAMSKEQPQPPKKQGKKPQKKEAQEPSLIDSAIVNPPKGEAAQAPVGGQRTLVKFATGSTPKQSMTLEEFGSQGSKKFDQFEGKNSSYVESIYTSSLDESKITA